MISIWRQDLYKILFSTKNYEANIFKLMLTLNYKLFYFNESMQRQIIYDF